MSKSNTDISKFLSYVLRHAPASIGLQLDSEGWGDVATVLLGAKRAGLLLSPERLAEVVASNDKKRFALSADGQKIRAVQGHSTSVVAIDYIAQTPPPALYHGTAQRFLPSILREGLRPQSRHHVHLSADVATAKKVGARHGKVVVLQIDIAGLQAQGARFFQAENGVWLIDAVPVGFFQPITD